jgi:hypothetical protein
LQFGVERNENRGSGQSDEQKGDGHSDILRSIPIDLGRYAQNSDPRYEAEKKERKFIKRPRRTTKLHSCISKQYKNIIS